MFSFITLFQRARVRWELSDFTRKYSAAIQFECDTRKIINFANLARCVRPSSNFTNFEDLPKWSSDQVTHFRRVLILTRLISTHEKECIESNGKKRSKLRNDEADSTRRATINQLLSRATDIKGYRKSWTIFFPISGFPLSLVTPYIYHPLSFLLFFHVVYVPAAYQCTWLSLSLSLSLSFSLSLSLRSAADYFSRPSTLYLLAFFRSKARLGKWPEGREREIIIFGELLVIVLVKGVIWIHLIRAISERKIRESRQLERIRFRRYGVQIKSRNRAIFRK